MTFCTSGDAVTLLELIEALEAAVRDDAVDVSLPVVGLLFDRDAPAESEVEPEISQVVEVDSDDPDDFTLVTDAIVSGDPPALAALLHTLRESSAVRGGNQVFLRASGFQVEDEDWWMLQDSPIAGVAVDSEGGRVAVAAYGECRTSAST